jgi:signal transducing adaptor molecule
MEQMGESGSFRLRTLTDSKGLLTRSNSPRNCVAAILKRLVHRNANVQLYSLTLSDALSKNCGELAHQELASRSFTQTLQRIIVDRNTHETVKKKSLSLIKEWNSEWGNDESLGLIRETMNALKSQGK